VVGVRVARRDPNREAGRLRDQAGGHQAGGSLPDDAATDRRPHRQPGSGQARRGDLAGGPRLRLGHREEADRDLRLAKEAGFTWVKQRFEWRNIEKIRKNDFQWTEPDIQVDKINKAGLGSIARLDNQPDWARKDKIFPASGPPDNMEDWKDFVQQLAERYKGKIQIYEIWNEPNISREWGT